MKFLLAQSSPYSPSLNGASKANRLLLEAMAARGHYCKAVALSSCSQSLRSHTRYLDDLEIKPITDSATVETFTHNGVEVQAFANGSQIRSNLRKMMDEFAPDWTLVSNEDPAQILLDAAVRHSPDQVVSLVHTPIWLPFGPQSQFPSRDGTRLLGMAAGIITVSDFAKDYIKTWSGLDSAVIRFPVYGAAPFPLFGCRGQGFVTMINPCEYKGISIFLALAHSLPEIEFAAVPTWGTTEKDRAALEQLPNVRTLKPVDDIDQIFAQTRMLVVPSLWKEAFGLIAVEAMLRGLPVIASNQGGLPEAMLGLDYVLPVNPIQDYKEEAGSLDAEMFAVVPEQDIGPWKDATKRLVSDRNHYERLSLAALEAATAFASRIGCEPFEQYLEQLAAELPCKRVAQTARPATNGGSMLGRVDNLSPEKLALLTLRLTCGQIGKSSRQSNAAAGQPGLTGTKAL